jgi:hypothetical protein
VELLVDCFTILFQSLGPVNGKIERGKFKIQQSLKINDEHLLKFVDRYFNQSTKDYFT